MPSGADVLERKVIHAGDVFIKAGEENIRAYVVQKGMARAFIFDGEDKVEVSRCPPGTIIGETCLMLDDPIALNYEAMMDTTVVTITRQDFEKKLMRVDGSVKTILNCVMSKLSGQDGRAIDEAKERARIDNDAYALMQGFVAGVSLDKKNMYEKALLPHVNGLIKEIKKLKSKDRHEVQAQQLKEKQEQIADDGEE